jgi:hypothetical protein
LQQANQSCSSHNAYQKKYGAYYDACATSALSYILPRITSAKASQYREEDILASIHQVSLRQGYMLSSAQTNI